MVNLNNMRKFYCTKKHPKVVSGNTDRLSFQTSNSSIPFWHASMACQTSLAEPWFTFWRDILYMYVVKLPKTKRPKTPKTQDLISIFPSYHKYELNRKTRQTISTCFIQLSFCCTKRKKIFCEHFTKHFFFQVKLKNGKLKRPFLVPLNFVRTRDKLLTR